MSGKNLTSVCKLVFKVAQDDENDALFLEDNFLGEYEVHCRESVAGILPFNNIITSCPVEMQ